jgi:hypothetical protein
MTTWTDEHDLVLVQALARTREWREADRAPVRFVHRDATRESVVHEFLRAIFEPTKA